MVVGTLFGNTKEVDMVHTRKPKDLRLRIGCLHHTLIPETTDVFIQRGFFKLAFDVEPVTVTQLGHDGIEDIGGNNGGDDDNGANGDNGDDANDMDFEKIANNENQNNGNKRNGNIKQGNNGNGVVSHQAQEQVKAPIFLGSLNNDLLSKGMENAKTIVPSDVLQHSSHLRLNSGENSNFIELYLLFYVAADKDSTGISSHIDYAPGLVKTWPESTLGSVQMVTVVSKQLVGSHSPLGASRLAEPAPRAPSPLPRAPLSPRSP
jgi:hypothetical protein